MRGAVAIPLTALGLVALTGAGLLSACEPKPVAPKPAFNLACRFGNHDEFSVTTVSTQSVESEIGEKKQSSTTEETRRLKCKVNGTDDDSRQLWSVTVVEETISVDGKKQPPAVYAGKTLRLARDPDGLFNVAIAFEEGAEEIQDLQFHPQMKSLLEGLGARENTFFPDHDVPVGDTWPVSAPPAGLAGTLAGSLLEIRPRTLSGTGALRSVEKNVAVIEVVFHYDAVNDAAPEMTVHVATKLVYTVDLDKHRIRETAADTDFSYELKTTDGPPLSGKGTVKSRSIYEYNS